MGSPCEPRSLIFLRKYNEMGAGQLSVPPVHELLEHFMALDGETDPDSGVLGMKISSFLVLGNGKLVDLGDVRMQFNCFGEGLGAKSWCTETRDGRPV